MFKTLLLTATLASTAAAAGHALIGANWKAATSNLTTSLNPDTMDELVVAS
jgi:hypothetical protein